jgi:SagB-type dehydrogenase family enzyme
MLSPSATLVAVLLMTACAAGEPGASPPAGTPEALPAPELAGTTSVEEALAARRSVRDFAPMPLSEATLAQILWAAQGTTTSDGRRTAPSAGGLYPLEIYVATPESLVRYLPDSHRIERLADRDLRADLARLAAGQEWIAEAGAVVVVVGVTARTAAKYGDRAERYVILEAGHAAQNVLLQAAALGLGATVVGAFDDTAVHELLGLPSGYAVLELIPVGHRQPG